MKIDIKTSGFPLTEALKQHAERRLHFALSWADGHVRRSAVRLSDENGPRGGAVFRILMPAAQTT